MFEHFVILLGGRVAEELIYNVSVTTGAINDFTEALKLAEKMILYYGMGTNNIIPRNSEKYKEQIDNEIFLLIEKALTQARALLSLSKDFIIQSSIHLKKNKVLTIDELNNIMYNHHPELFFLR